MKSLTIVIALVSLTCCTFAQGSFQNLSFDRGKIVSMEGYPPFVVSPEAALPAWAYSGEAWMVLNTLGIGSAMVSIHDQYSPFVSVLEGKYTLFFQRRVPGGNPIPSVSQTAVLPDWAYSLQYKTGNQSSSAFGPDSFDVTFDGQLLPRTLLETTDTYRLWAVDLMPVFGEYGELRFAGWGALDALQFSTVHIPEPSTLPLVLSALVTCILCRCSTARPSRIDPSGLGYPRANGRDAVGPGPEQPCIPAPPTPP